MSDEAYERGYREHEKPYSENPYEEGTVEFRRWIDGMVQGMIDARKPVDGGEAQ